MLVVVLLLVALVAPLGALTASGERQRGGSLPLAALAGVLFPLTWTVWYLLDEDLHHSKT